MEEKDKMMSAEQLEDEVLLAVESDEESVRDPKRRKTSKKPNSSKTFQIHTKLTPQQLKVRRKLLVLLTMHLQNFQRVILMSRHRFHQRMRRRQALLRSFYVQQLVELETQFLEMIPLPRVRVLDTPQSADESATKSSTDEKETPDSTPTYELAFVQLSEEQWINQFRMRRKTFEWLCDQLREALQPNTVNAPLKNLISLEKRVALSLYAFASGEDYGSIAAFFDISRASVCKFVHRFAEVLLEKFGHSLLALPRSEEEHSEVRRALHQISNMPGVVVGVLGHCKLSVSPVTKDASSFINDAGGCNIMLEALIDDKLLFRKVQLQTKRPLLFLEEPNDITELPAQVINGRELPCCVVTSRDSQYPLRPWLMQHYEDPVAPHEYDFNEAVDNLLLVQKQAFLRLFARWRILQRELEPRTMGRVAMACCALHNLLEENKEDFPKTWNNHINITNMNLNPSTSGAKVMVDSEVALEMRDFLARTISSTEM